MSLVSRFLFEPKLSLDGLMTLIAGVIAFVAVMLQIKSSREAVERQLHENIAARATEEERQKTAVARALLFEIANFYGFYRVHIRPRLDRVDIENCVPPTLSAPGPDFFAVYHGSAGRLGAFEFVVVEKVVRFFGLAELLLTNVRQYIWSLDRELEQKSSVQPGSAPRKLLQQIHQVMYPTDAAAVEAMEKLCEITGVKLESLKLPG